MYAPASLKDILATVKRVSEHGRVAFHVEAKWKAADKPNVLK